MRHDPIIHAAHCGCPICAPRPVMNLRPLVIGAALSTPLIAALLCAVWAITPA